MEVEAAVGAGGGGGGGAGATSVSVKFCVLTLQLQSDHTALPTSVRVQMTLYVPTAGYVCARSPFASGTSVSNDDAEPSPQLRSWARSGQGTPHPPCGEVTPVRLKVTVNPLVTVGGWMVDDAEIVSAVRSAEPTDVSTTATAVLHP